MVARGQKHVPESVKIFESWGLKVGLGPHIYAQYYQYAGTDAERAEDLQWALDDPTIKAVVAVRGGYGTPRIVDRLNFTKFLRHPKWVVGYSDLTGLLVRFQQLGVASVHGEMPKNFLDPQYTSSIESLRSFFFGGTAHLVAEPNSLNREGAAAAPVVGGNLTLLCNSIGTLSELDTNKKILVIEEIGEEIYALDRAMLQLKRAGMLENLAGLVVGHMTAMKDDASNAFGKSGEEVVKEHVVCYNYPVAFHLPIGHQAPNLAFPHGSVGQLSVTQDRVHLEFALKE